MHRYGRDVVFKIRFSPVALDAGIKNQVPVVVERSDRYETSSNDVFFCSRTRSEWRTAIRTSNVLEWPATKQRVWNACSGQDSIV